MPPSGFNGFDDYEYNRELEYYEPRRRRWLHKVLRPDKPAINVFLFILTLLTTFFTGYFSSGSVSDGFWFSFGIMSILLSHEMGHYVMCRKYGVPATLPFFIPFPPIINPFGPPYVQILNPFGTMGAVIKMEGQMPNRRVLFDIGAGGPLAGLVVTIPAIYFGLKMSEIVDLTDWGGGFTLGESLLFQGMIWLAKGKLAANQDVLLHPLAFAGWAGLFVTALNLLPIGQLDGGHVLYALFGEKSQYIFAAALGAFALVCIFFYPGWILLIVLLLWFGFRHPPPMDPVTPLDPVRRNLAIIIFIVFVLSFTPVPFKIM